MEVLFGGFVVLIIIVLFLHFFLKSILEPSYVILILSLGSYAGYLGRIALSTEIQVSLFQVFLIFSIVVLVLYKITNNNLMLKTSGLELEFLLFFSIIFLSLIYSPSTENGFIYSLRVFALVVMVFVVINTVNKVSHIRNILIAITVFGIVLAVFSINEGFKTENLVTNLLTMGKKLRGRSSINVEDPNIFASHFFMPIMFSLSLLVSKHSKLVVKITSGLIVIILLSGLAATLSRSAWLSAGIGILFVTIFNKEYRIYIFLFIALLIVLVLSPSARLIVENILQRVGDIFAGTSDDSSRTRMLLLLAGIKMGFESILIGVGFRGFPANFNEYYSTFETIGVNEPHNILYTLFAELGIVGLLVYLMIIYKIAYAGRVNLLQSKTKVDNIINGSLLASFISYFVFYQFYGGGLTDNNFWLIVSFILSVRLIYIKSTNNEYK